MFSLEYVNDINIQEAVIHILDSNSPDPILNEFTLELTEDIYKFLYRHIEKCFKDEELKTAVFKEERNIVKEIVQDYLNGVDHDIVNLSKELARQLFAIMNGNTNIPSCDLIVVSLITDQGPMIGILKMDYVKNYTHQVDFVEDKIGIGILRPKIDFIFSDSSTKDRPLYSSILFSIAYSRNAFLTIGTYSSIIGAFDKDVSFK